MTRVVLRGDLPSSPHAADWLALAKGSGSPEIVVRTHGLGFESAARAEALRAAGATAVLVPLFSHHPTVHDRLVGRPGALSRTMAALSTLSAAGLGVELEIPLLPRKLQSLPALVSLVASVVPRPQGLHFMLPRSAQPPVATAPDWVAGREHLLSGLRAAAEAGFPVEMGPLDAIPMCALRGHPQHHRAFRLSPGGHDRSPGTRWLAPCETCAVRTRCAGVAESYAHAHGAYGLEPFAHFPRTLSAKGRVRGGAWSDARRTAARSNGLLVLRPTVNCNQDCGFCSVNETAGNVWASRREMLGQISRAAGRGVERLSFSGGEPTLSTHLPSYVRAARRLGIPAVEVVTNAVLLDSPLRVDALADAGLTHAFVSLHAHDEALSRRFTNKTGDFERTVRAVGLLLDAGVEVSINHVVSTANHRYLSAFVEFVYERWRGRVPVSFAFVTPNYKALENLELVPRLSDAMPDLRRALHRAVALRQPFVIGSRQGIPPCLLGEFKAWSDIFERASEALSEDAPLKVKSPSCVTCRFDAVCTGVWKHYAERHGLDELTPLPGAPLTLADAPRLRFGKPWSFEDVPASLRDIAAEDEGRALASTAPAPEPFRLTVVPAWTRSRPVRVTMIGAGRRARHLSRAAVHVDGLDIEAVVSPHAPDADPRAFDHRPTFRTSPEAFEGLRPEAVVIASCTAAHAEGLREAWAAGLPALVERPIAMSLEEARSLVADAPSGGAVLVGHSPVFLPGARRFLEQSGDALNVSWRLAASAPATPLAWSRAGIVELLHEVLPLAGHSAGALLDVSEAGYLGDSRPRQLKLVVRWQRRVAHVSVAFDSVFQELLLESGDAAWRRREGSVAVKHGDVWQEINGPSEVEAMLAHFRDVVLRQATPAVGLQDGVEAIRAVELALEALSRAGVEFERPNAPKHVASRRVRSTGS